MLLSRLFSRLRRNRVALPVADCSARITFFGGKGGVGKTTCATAWALQQAQPAQRVLLISTDPAHSLGDLVETALGPEPRAITPDLDALELAPDRALADYIAEVKGHLRELSSPELRAMAEQHADLAAAAPGAQEAALFEAMVRCILELGPHYQHLVFDTAPSGHTLPLLRLPEAMGAWAEAMLARRGDTRHAWSAGSRSSVAAEDRARALLEQRRQRFETVRTLFRDPRCSRFIPVLNPDALSVEETRRMLHGLDEHRMAVPLLLINRVIPDSADGSFAAELRQSQQRHLATIDRCFGHLRRWQIEHEQGELQGLEALSRLPLPAFETMPP